MNNCLAVQTVYKLMKFSGFCTKPLVIIISIQLNYQLFLIILLKANS